MIEWRGRMTYLVAFFVSEGDLDLPDVRKRVIASIRELGQKGTRVGWKWLPWPRVDDMLVLLGADIPRRQRKADRLLMTAIDTTAEAVERFKGIRDLFPYPFWIMECRDPVEAQREWIKVAGAEEVGLKPKAAHVRKLMSLLRLT
jgi:hypothetical protein